ncbi:hypothetical protein VC161_12775 [Citrobacter koseri]|uniref:hypothetical protein n=1 Tax=Citrobacter koseri TaxID=545 RepID=UPI002B36EC02|nr:hypothetical protein [Citrobacter koseri]MEB2728013.1 hypothetical protein [Citrobacter koseri]
MNLPDGDAGASYPAYRRACGVCEHCRMAMLVPDGDAGASYPAYRRACGVCEHCRMAMLAHLIRPTGGWLCELAGWRCWRILSGLQAGVRGV